jgi:hypothetical protein
VPPFPHHVYKIDSKGKIFLCNMCYVSYVTCVAIGDSGRIVLEVDPSLKRRLYSALQLERTSLKDWFIARAAEYVEAQQQPGLFGTTNRGETKSQ